MIPPTIAKVTPRSRSILPRLCTLWRPFVSSRRPRGGWKGGGRYSFSPEVTVIAAVGQLLSASLTQS